MYLSSDFFICAPSISAAAQRRRTGPLSRGVRDDLSLGEAGYLLAGVPGIPPGGPEYRGPEVLSKSLHADGAVARIRVRVAARVNWHWGGRRNLLAAVRLDGPATPVLATEGDFALIIRELLTKRHSGQQQKECLLPSKDLQKGLLVTLWVCVYTRTRYAIASRTYTCSLSKHRQGRCLEHFSFRLLIRTVQGNPFR